MPFKNRTDFDPDTIRLLQAAYDEACTWLGDLDPATRDNIAIRIIECAKTRERDKLQLKAYALAPMLILTHA